MITDPFAVLVVLAAVVYVAIVLDQQYRLFGALGSVLVAILLGMALSNAGFLPDTSPTYDFLSGTGVSAAIVLILLTVDVRSVFSAGPAMLAAFLIGAAGTALGAAGAALVMASQVGPETWKLAGQYTGTYIGGGVNMVAVGRALETSPDLFSAAVAADNVTTAVWMVACFGAPVFLARWWRGIDTRQERQERQERQAAHVSDTPNDFVASTRPVTVRDIAALGALAAAAVWAGELAGSRVPQIPSVLWLTTIVLLAAQVPAVRTLAGGPMLGNYALQLFLAGLGAQSLIGEIVRVGPAVFWFTLVVVGVHGLLVFGVGRLARLDLPTLAVASQANVGGPASAMAIATARGYPDRLLPGIAVGLLGYAVGNYAGFAVAGLLRGWLG